MFSRLQICYIPIPKTGRRRAIANQIAKIKIVVVLEHLADCGALTRQTRKQYFLTLGQSLADAIIYFTTYGSLYVLHPAQGQHLLLSTCYTMFNPKMRAISRPYYDTALV